MIPRGGAAHRLILETFAETGRSPTLEEIQRSLALQTVDEAEALVAELESAGSVHRNQNDPYVTHAYPFSNEPTPHRVRLANGPQVYAMCAIDALGMPFMLKRDAEISSLCASARCGQKIGISIASERVAKTEPARIVVWFADVRDGCVPATDLCPDLNFFCSPEHANEWTTEHSHQTGHLLTLDQAVQGGRSSFENLLEGAEEN